MKATDKKLPDEHKKELLSILENRFEKHPHRHKGLKWEDVLAKLEASPEKLWSLDQMEETGGEPDVVAYDAKTKLFHFYDCAAESPKGRRSICYDREALDARKQHKPENNAQEMAEMMGITILSEEEYRKLQELESFDTKTSSWVKTPDPIRKRGGALFCDNRYGTVFLYHNGADSYYAARGFRGVLKV